MLSIPLSTIGWIILKARELEVNDGDIVNADGDGDSESLLGMQEDRVDDSSQGELASWISDLNIQQQAELVALFWLGRDDGDASDFRDLLAQAQGQQGSSTARYLLRSPLLSDYLEEGLEKLGVNSSDLESDLT